MSEPKLSAAELLSTVLALLSLLLLSVTLSAAELSTSELSSMPISLQATEARSNAEINIKNSFFIYNHLCQLYPIYNIPHKKQNFNTKKDAVLLKNEKDRVFFKLCG